MKLLARTKAAVSAVSSLFGTIGTALTRPVGGTLMGWVREPFAGAWQQGVQVEALGALTAYGAVYASVSRIANDVAKLQPRLMAQDESGLWIPAAENSPHWLPLRRPNGFQNRIQFFAYWLTCKLLHGNAYALKARDERNMVRALYLLDPRRVTPMVTPEGDVYYSLGGDDLARLPGGGVVPASEIIHDRMNCLWHPLVGISPIYACAISATQGLRIQANSAQFFGNMSRPSGMLTAPGTIDEVTAARLKGEFERNFGGANIGRLFVAGDDLKYAPMTIPAEAAQLIEQLKWTVEDVARCFLMPLYKIGAGTMPTSNNVEALNQQYYDDCLQPHIEALELCLDEGLAVPARHAVEFDLDGLLRMDHTAKVKMLAEGVSGALMKPNEARRRLNLPPVTGGDTIYLQQQNYSLEALAKRDARPDPFAAAAAAPAPAAPPAAAPAPAPAPQPAKDLTAQLLADIAERAKALPDLITDTEAAHA